MKDYRKLATAELKRLRELARDKAITDGAIADQTGLQRSNVNRMLSGRYMPRLDLYMSVKDAIEK